MMMKLVAAASLCVHFAVALADETDVERESFYHPDCTTTEKIQYLEVIRLNDNMSEDDTRGAILKSLGYSSSDTSGTVKQYEAQWFYEYSEANVIFAGYTVRSHYLQVVIEHDEEAVSTIVCDSLNLKQSKSRIHRKVPLWKAQLDSRIRVALGRASEKLRAASTELNRELADLKNLHDKKIITDAEFVELKARIVGKELEAW